MTQTQSLRLQITDFRAWKHLDFELKPGEVTLVQGASGSGKSTIIRALMWVLFGKERLITPVDKPNAKTEVRLTMPINVEGEWCLLEVIRRKNPTNVRARLASNEAWAVDIEAQALISSCMVGTTDPDAYQGWLAGSYLGRAGGNSFIQGSTAEKMAILDRLAFAGDKPNQVLDKLKLRVRDAKAVVQRKQAVYDHEAEQLGESPDKISLKKLAQAQDLKQKATDCLAEARAHQKHYHQVLREREALATKLTLAQNPIPVEARPALKQPVSWLPADPCLCWESTRDCGRDDCLGFLRRISSIKTRDMLTARLATMTLAAPGPCLSDELLEERRRQHAAISYAEQTLNRYGLAYTEGAVKARLAVISESVLRHRVGIYYQELDGLVLANEPDPVAAPSAVAPVVEYGTLKDASARAAAEAAKYVALDKELHGELARREREPDTVDCPKCEAALVITATKTLVLAADSHLTKQAALDQIQAQIKANRQLLTVAVRDAQAISETISVIDKEHREEMARYTRLLRSQEIAYSQYVADTKRIRASNEVIETKRRSLETKLAGCTRQEALSPEAYQALVHEQADLQRLSLPLVYASYEPEVSRRRWHETSWLLAELDLPDYPLSECQAVLAWLEKGKLVHERYHRLVSEQQLLVASLTQRLDELEVLEPYPRTEAYLLERIAFAESTLTARAVYASWLTKRGIVTELKKQATLASDDYRRVSQLLKIAVQTESSLVEDVADQLNLDMSEYCPRLFPDTETVARLQLSKSAKTSEARQYRPELVIDHRGNQNVKLSTLSDGEGDRVSIAFVLAMSFISGSPILILDESLASLNAEYKHEAVELIRQRGPRYSLMVMHEGVSGIFDRVIDLDQLRR